MDDWGGLENRCSFRATVGSNPTPSAASEKQQPFSLKALLLPLENSCCQQANKNNMSHLVPGLIQSIPEESGDFSFAH